MTARTFTIGLTVSKFAPIRQGSMLLAEEYFECGDDRFVEELRCVTDADRLGEFARRWIDDSRPIARQFLKQYLSHPLNCARHEAIIKRLFKLAEKAQDDELMGLFLRAFDVSIRRRKRVRRNFNWVTREVWIQETVVPPRDTMPRKFVRVTGWFQHLRLFSLLTRRYVTRRTWRYFRQIGKTDPARYVNATTQALLTYTDADTPDGLAMIDNWGMMHILFHHTEILTARPSGWHLRPSQHLENLAPAPAFPEAWRQSPESLWTLLTNARARVVRQWAFRLLKQEHGDFLASQPVLRFLELVRHSDDDIARFAAENAASSRRLNALTAEQWFAMLSDCNPAALETLCQALSNDVDPVTIAFDKRIMLACSRPESMAEVGLKLLRLSTIRTSHEARLLSPLANAECEVLRPQILEWLRTVLASTETFASDSGEQSGADTSQFATALVMDLLDSRFQDVRDFGWTWFEQTAEAAGDVSVWQKLLESPYDDIRFRVVRMLQQQPAPETLDAASRGRLSADLIRSLWASVLLNVHRGSRQKPVVLTQIAARLRKHPDEAGVLLPLVASSLRSIRGPEWKAALAMVVQLAEVPELQEHVTALFPQIGLNLVGGSR